MKPKCLLSSSFQKLVNQSDTVYVKTVTTIQLTEVIMAIIVICSVIAFMYGIAITLDRIDRRADTIEILLDGIIDRLNTLEKK